MYIIRKEERSKINNLNLPHRKLEKEDQGNPVHYWWECKLVQSLWKTMEIPKNI